MQFYLVLTAFLWSVLFWRKDGISSAAEPGYLDFDNLPETNFSCEGKVIGGYYADVETGCQMFHVCTIGQKGEITDIKFLCLNGTVFDQETRVCERLDEVDCSKSESFFDLNLELYGNKAPHSFGIEPENEEVVAEECNPNDDEECQKLDESETDEDTFNNERQTTYTPLFQQQTTTRRPQPTIVPPLPSPPQHNLHHHHRLHQQTQQQHFHRHQQQNTPLQPTAPHQRPTVTTHPSPPTPRPLSTVASTLLPSTSTATPIPATTIIPQVNHYQSSSPESIAALLALHNAFQQSLQLHEIEGDEVDDEDDNDDDDDVPSNVEDGSSRQQGANNNNKNINNNSNRGNSFHNINGNNNDNQFQLSKQQQSDYQQYPHRQTQQTLPRPPQSNHHFPFHQQQRVQQPTQSQVFQPIRTSPQAIQSERFGSPFVHQRFQSQNFPQNQQHRNQLELVPLSQPQSQTEPPKPFSYHQQQQQFDHLTTSSSQSPYLLHQLKVNRVKEEQKQQNQQLSQSHGNYIRQTSHRSIPLQSPSPSAIAVVTSTSTTTSVRSGGANGNGNGKQFAPSRHIIYNNQHHQQPHHPGNLNINNNRSSLFYDNRTTVSTPHLPSSYDEYQESDVRSDPFFHDVPKIARTRRHINFYEPINEIKSKTNQIHGNSSDYNNTHKDRRRSYLEIIKGRRKDDKSLNTQSNMNSYKLTNGKDNGKISYKGNISSDVEKINTSNVQKQGFQNNKENHNAILLDGLQLSPEEKNLFNEISAVMSKYIIPPKISENFYYSNNTGNGKLANENPTVINNKTDVLSARDKHRLNLFVTKRNNRYFRNSKIDNNKRNRKKRSDKIMRVVNDTRLKPDVEKISEDGLIHRYEVLEIVDEPSTIQPFVNFLSRTKSIFGSIATNNGSRFITDVSDTSTVIKSNDSYGKTTPTKNLSVTKIDLPLRELTFINRNQSKVDLTEYVNNKNSDDISSETQTNLNSTFQYLKKLPSSSRRRLTFRSESQKSPSYEDGSHVDKNRGNVESPSASKIISRVNLNRRNSKNSETSQLFHSNNNNNEEIMTPSLLYHHEIGLAVKGVNSYSTTTETPLKSTTIILKRRRKIAIPLLKNNDTLSSINNDSESLQTNNNYETYIAPDWEQMRVKIDENNDSHHRITRLKNNYEVVEVTTVPVPSTFIPRSYPLNSRKDLNRDETSSENHSFLRNPLNDRKSSSRSRSQVIDKISYNSNSVNNSTTQSPPRLRQRGRISQRFNNEEITSLKPQTDNQSNRNNRERPISRRRNSTLPVTLPFSSEEQSPTTLRSSRRRLNPIMSNRDEIPPLTTTLRTTRRRLNKANHSPINNNSDALITTTTISTTHFEIPSFNDSDMKNDGNFTCDGKIKGGFYADMDSDCRGFFICSQGALPDDRLLKTHFWCGQATKFNQRSRTCQADYLVECSISPRYFSLNNDFAVPSEEKDMFEPKKIT